MIKPEEEVFDGQDFHIPEARLPGILPQSVSAHHGAGAGRVMIGHSHRQTVQDAPAVHHPFHIVAFGELQSNHARITAAAARKLGLEPHLFYFEARPEQFTSNLLLSQLMGAHLYFLPLGAGGDANMTLETTNRLVHLLAWLRVGRHYFIPVGGYSWRGCLGYVRAAIEIESQARAFGLENAHLVLAAGTGGTWAGTLAGLSLMDSSLSLLGIDVGKLWKGFPTSLARLTGEICGHLGAKRVFEPGEIPLLERIYAAPKYGLPSPGCRDAIRRLARTEGILLDPVYTGKAFAGLLDLVEKAR